jgi:hypothetical protein
MASSVTELDIVNRALDKLGEKNITSLTQDVKQARVMSTLVDPVRDRFLRKNPWNCAITRVQLAASTTAPAFGWATAYPLPSDFIKLLNVESSSSTSIPLSGNKNTPRNIEYKIEGGSILCDETDALNVRYVKRLTDTTRYDSSMVEALATLYALEACMSLTNDTSLRSELKQEYMQMIQEAKQEDGWEDDMPDFPLDSWISATL